MNEFYRYEDFDEFDDQLNMEQETKAQRKEWVEIENLIFENLALHQEIQAFKKSVFYKAYKLFRTSPRP